MSRDEQIGHLMDSSEVRFEDGIWKGPVVTPPEGYYKVGGNLLRIMRENAATVAQIDAATGFQDTYGSMADRCIRCALWLRKQGIRPGDVIGLYTNRHLDAIIPIFSSLMVGSISSTWWPRDTADDLLSKAEMIKPKILFVENTHAQLLQKAFQKTKMDVTLVSFQKMEGFISFEEILTQQDSREVGGFQCAQIESPDTPAIIIFTSGTTDAAPKAVLLSHRTLGFADAFIPDNSTGNNCGLILPQLEWITGVVFTFGVVKTAATLIIHRGTVVGHDLFASIEKYKIKWIRMYTSHAREFMNAMQHYDFSSVKYARFGGDVVNKNFMEKIAATFPNALVHYSYGSTETGGNICGQIFGQPKFGSVGKVSRNVELKIVAETGEIVKRSKQPGVIYVKSLRQMIGYYNNPGDTARAVNTEGWYCTGDYGYFDGDGNIFVMDRLTDMIKCKCGYTSSQAIENVIKEHPGVFEAAVVAKTCDDGETPTAFVVRKPDVDVTEKDIVEWMKNSTFKDVNDVKFVSCLPKTQPGKIQKAALRRMLASSSSRMKS